RTRHLTERSTTNKRKPSGWRFNRADDMFDINGDGSMAEVTNEFLARMIQARFTALAKDISATHHKLDMLTASFNDLAQTHATHGEIEAVHSELDRLRQSMTELEARVGELEPSGLD